ncbi:MAG: adenylosuccinate lyase [Elusimicrobia bacterium]|nr:adenylosuccinate lyase [Elusimicrobiota bacterium]
MISRYSRPEMVGIWTDQNRLEKMLQVEILACEALALRGKVPMSDVKTIKKRARIDIEEIARIEKVVKHDVIAFLTQVERSVGKAARHLHLGMTSSDVLDTALSIQLVEATALLQEGLETLRGTVAQLARQHKQTVMVGRTHGVHAEPITFGIKLAGWYCELKRDQERLKRAREIVAVGKISGAVGTYAHIEPFVEQYVCKQLHLDVEPVSTQIVPRDRHAEYVSLLAVVASALERMALEIRHLQRTEVQEAEEPFTEGQRGSSAMPHKRNPIACENVCGLARLMRSYAQAALENVALWHERDISHSSVERVILPDATILLDFMIHRMIQVLSGLTVRPEKMQENMKKTFWMLASQRLMIELLNRGGKKLSRDNAYRIVQNLAQRAWTQNQDFKKLVLNDPEIRSILKPDLIQNCFDPAYFLRHTAAIFKNAGL